MQSKSDAQLLREYADGGVEAAFAEIVHRHTNLVYSAALRLVNSPDIAPEIAQNVFIGLARGAQTLSAQLTAEASLAGWLCRSTRNQALKLWRDDSRRHSRERQAMELFNPISETVTDWESLRPVLDEAMAELPEPDYDVLVLRFFNNHDLRAVGRALGVSDDTAQKRVARALDKLRENLTRRGVATTGAALSIVISANAVQAAPVGLAVTILTAAALAGTTIAATATGTAIKTIAMTTLQKIIIGATLAAAVGAGIYEARQNSRLRDQNESLQQQTAQLKTESESLSNRLTAVGNTQSPSAKSLLDEQYNELLRLRGMAGVARRAIGEAEQLRAQLARQASEATNNPITGAMADAAKQAAEQQMEGRLSRMAASLHLTAEQAQAARDILMRQARVMLAGMQQGFSGKYDKEELLRLAKEAGNPDEQIRALLTPDQQASYPAYQREEAAHNASLAANQELVQMQSTIGLTSEQLDRVYAALYEVSLNQPTGSTRPASTNQQTPGDLVAAQAEAMQQWANDKAKALESILTPTQLESYRQQQALQAKLVKEMMNNMQGSAKAK